MAQTLTSTSDNVEVDKHIKKLLNDYTSYLKYQKNRSPRTITAYSDVVGRWLSRGPAILGSVREFLRDAAPSLSSSSQAQWISALKNFLVWAESESKIPLASKLQKELFRPKVTQRMVEIVEEEDLSLLLRTLESRPPEEQFLFELLYGSGLRISEALNLNLKDVNFQNQELKVLGKGSKVRKVPLTPAALQYLGQCEQKKKSIPWSKAYTVRTLRKWVEKWGKFSLLDERTGSLHPHKLRHSIASHLLKRGATLPQIQKLLGHKQLSTTQRYTHINVEDLLKTYDQSFPKLKNK